MKPLYSVEVSTPYGNKSISVYNNDITTFDLPIDVLTTSAFFRIYAPSRGTIFGALFNHGIDARALANDPLIDLRDIGNVWLSKEISPNGNIRHLGCIELTGTNGNTVVKANEKGIIRNLKSYFYMLDIASNTGISIKSLALPLLGTGNQRTPVAMTMIPIISECLAFLKRNASIENIYFVEKNEEKANIIVKALKDNYAIISEKIPDVQDEPKATRVPKVFISYSSADRNITENLCSKLEAEGYSVWYAPRDVSSPYAESIVKGIQEAEHFVVILSQNSLRSEHVLNEIDLAFKKLPDRIKFHPLRIDEIMFTPSFEYYLSRQHWTDAKDPPLEKRLIEFIKTIQSKE